MLKQLFLYFKNIQSTKWMKGLELAIEGSILGALYNGHLPQTEADFKVIGLGCVSAGVLYILHNVPGVVAPEYVNIPYLHTISTETTPETTPETTLTKTP
jgi:hypothetical protein